MKRAPLIVHIIYRLGVGGMENGLVNLINQIPPGRYRHAVVCLKEATAFSQRIQRPDVEVIALHRREGHDFAMFAKLFRVLRRLRPDIVHTRNLAALECQLPAWLAGVRGRVHGEHGWDVADPGGTNKKYQWLRRVLRPWVRLWIPLSLQQKYYLAEKVGVPARQIRHICNGVDTAVFHPAAGGKSSVEACPFQPSDGLVVFGTVGRMHGVKDQMNLARAFLRLLQIRPQAGACARLIMVGDGPLRRQAEEALREAGAGALAWLPGERSDVAEVMRGLDVFVLPSQAEGICNAILEAMATGLPVVATAVGGNPELVVDGVTGTLVPPSNPDALAEALAAYLDDRARITSEGAAGLRRAHERFSLDGMVGQYMAVYDELLQTNS